MQSRKSRGQSGPANRELIEYLEVPLRRPWHVGIAFVLVAGAAVASSYMVPARYRSSTLILVEAEQVPESFVGSVATERVSRRLNTVKQEMLSRTRLETVIRELEPYGAPGKNTLTDMVEWMRSSAAVTVKGNDAFGLEFVHSDPQTAQKVADRLAHLFIDETVQGRKQQVSGAYEFLEDELQSARKQIEQREEALRKYKEQHMGTLPEQLNANLATLQRLQLEQQQVAESLRAAMDRVAALESGTPKTPTGPDGRAELAQLRTQLASLRTRYTDEHPDVQALLGQISQMEASVRNTHAAPASGNGQLEQARIELRNLQERRADLDRDISKFQSRVELAPRTEQEIVTLTRDFQKLNDNYLALLNKKLEAQLATKLEQRWQGDRFRILDPANLPESPYYPNRMRFLLWGIMAGLAVGVGVALLADVLDHSIRTVRELEEVLPFPVLAAVPVITPLSLPVRRRGGGDSSRPDRHVTTLGLGSSPKGVAYIKPADRSSRPR